MNIPQGYNEAKTSFDGFSKIPNGVYKFKIIRFENGFTKENNTPRILVKCDIADGQYACTFEEMSLERNKDLLLKINYNLTDKGMPFLKGFITSVERTNQGFKFDWQNEFQILDKYFYGYLSQTEKWYEITGIRSKKEEVPEPKQKPVQNIPQQTDDCPF